MGFLAGNLHTAADMRGQVRAFPRARSAMPFAINVFTPRGSPTEPAVYASYVERLQSEARRAGVQLGEPRVDDDDWKAKLAALSGSRRPSFRLFSAAPRPMS